MNTAQTQEAWTRSIDQQIAKIKKHLGDTNKMAEYEAERERIWKEVKDSKNEEYQIRMNRLWDRLFLND